MIDAIFYSAMGVIGSLPVFLVVAASSRTELATAKSRVIAFLEDWGGMAPGMLIDWVRLAFGSTLAFGFMIALAYGFNLLGDHSMPAVSSRFGHFGNDITEWSVNHVDDWKNFKQEIRAAWGKAHPEQNIVSDPVAWETWKNQRGKRQVRAPRTLIVFAFVMLIAGVIDIAQRRYIRRGLVCAVIGLVSIPTLCSIWVDRKAHYIEEVIGSNSDLGEQAVELPDSHPMRNAPRDVSGVSPDRDQVPG